MGKDSKKVEAEVDEKRTIEAWFTLKNPELWNHRAANSLFVWPVGKLLTEKEYDAALYEAAHLTLR